MHTHSHQSKKKKLAVEINFDLKLVYSKADNINMINLFSSLMNA